jgi:hypothetical protein
VNNDCLDSCFGNQLTASFISARLTGQRLDASTSCGHFDHIHNANAALGFRLNKFDFGVAYLDGNLSVLDLRP